MLPFDRMKPRKPSDDIARTIACPHKVENGAKQSLIGIMFVFFFL